jgi:hypothetical protein
MALALKANQFRHRSIVLQESKIQRCRKSRESGFLDVSAAAIPRSADVRVRGCFCANNEIAPIASHANAGGGTEDCITIQLYMDSPVCSEWRASPMMHPKTYAPDGAAQSDRE